MKIGFIGAGKVGFSLAKWLNINYHNVYSIYSLNIEDAKKLSEFSISEYCKSIDEIICNCDTLFLTVNDDSISDVVKELIKLNIKNKILIHTSGVLSSDIFNELNNDNYCYSIHPICAFNDKYESYKNLDNIYFTIEGNPKYIDELSKLFKNVKVIDKKYKEKYHLASSIISNLVCSVINVGERLFNEIGIDDKEIYNPLIINNINNIMDKGTRDALTGPIIRNDYNTVKKHISNLEGNDLLIYKYLGLNIINMISDNNIDYSKIKKLLEDI